MRYICIPILILLLVFTHCSYTDAANSRGSFFGEDFESITTLDPAILFMTGNATTQIVTDPVNDDNQCLKFMLNRKSDRVPFRSELQVRELSPRYFDYGRFAKIGYKFWYGVKMLVPAGWKDDTHPEIVIQWHAQPDFGLQEAWRSPPLALVIDSDGKGGPSQFVLTLRADSKRVTASKTKAPKYQRTERFILGPIGPGLNKWTDWVFNIGWSYGKDGFVRVWKDGELVLDHTGPNCFNDKYGPFLKFGLYKWVWNPKDAQYAKPYGIDAREIYFDDIRIGAGKMSAGDFGVGK